MSMKENYSKSTMLALALIFLAAASRLIPHPPNWTVIGAISILSGAVIASPVLRILTPVFALFLSDLVLGLHSTMWGVYLPVIVMVIISSGLLRKFTLTRIVASSLINSVLFFVVSNFAVWVDGILYPRTMEGLAQCYFMAVPFFHYQVLGDLISSATIFGLYFAAQNMINQVRKI